MHYPVFVQSDGAFKFEGDVITAIKLLKVLGEEQVRLQYNEGNNRVTTAADIAAMMLERSEGL